MELSQKVVHEAQRLIDEERLAEAVFLLQRVAAETTNMLSIIYSGNWDERKALEYVKLSTKIDFDNWATHSNASHTYSLFLKYEEARKEAVKAIKLSDGMQYVPIFNYAVSLANLMRIEEATQMYKAVLNLNPNYNTAHYNLSYTLLIEGKLGEAWPHYEYRTKSFGNVNGFVDRFKDYQQWEGEDLTGKTIVMYNEQGIGDLIFFGRFLPWLKEKKNAAKVIVETQSILCDVMRSSFPGIDFVPRGNGPIYETPPVGDLVSSINSLAYRFEINKVEDIPAPVKYIKCETRTAPRFLNKPNPKLKIGFSWAGNPAHPLDAQRSVYLNMFRDISNLSHVQLFSLQKEAHPVREWYGKLVNLRQGAAGLNYTDLSPYLKDFSDTVACVNSLDIVITIDSALAHLAAALGKPVWVPMQFNNDWRWMQNTDKSPWYPTMRLFRQPTFGDWKAVFENITKQLAEVPVPPR